MPQGFIHDELDVKLLVLYILSRAAGPLDFAALTDLALCDSGVDYFLYAQVVSDLVKSGHILLDDNLYTITAKGRESSAALEGTLPSVIRHRCDRALSQLNDIIRRASQVTAEIAGEGSQYTVTLRLSDGIGPLLHLSLAVPSQETAQRIAENFKARPEGVYSAITALLSEAETPSDSQE